MGKFVACLAWPGGGEVRTSEFVIRVRFCVTSYFCDGTALTTAAARELAGGFPAQMHANRMDMFPGKYRLADSRISI